MPLDVLGNNIIPVTNIMPWNQVPFIYGTYPFTPVHSGKAISMSIYCICGGGGGNTNVQMALYNIGVNGTFVGRTNSVVVIDDGVYRWYSADIAVGGNIVAGTQYVLAAMAETNWLGMWYDNPVGTDTCLRVGAVWGTWPDPAVWFSYPSGTNTLYGLYATYRYGTPEAHITNKLLAAGLI